jgi:hypothetical protein
MQTAQRSPRARFSLPRECMLFNYLTSGAKSLSANCSAGFQTDCTGGFQAARDGVCRSGDLHDSRSGERRYKFRNLRISSNTHPAT